MTEHTPGPWFVSSDPSHYDSDTEVVDKVGDHLASMAGKNVFNMEANARLMASAPELLDALIELKEWIENDCGAECPSDKARAAIAKAEGRS